MEAECISRRRSEMSWVSYLLTKVASSRLDVGSKPFRLSPFDKYTVPQCEKRVRAEPGIDVASALVSISWHKELARWEWRGGEVVVIYEGVPLEQGALAR